MPRRKLGARLWLQPAYRRPDGHTEPAVWCIKDGRHKHSTSYGLADCQSADHPALQDALATYLGERTQPSRQSNRSADQVAVGDVIAIYLADKVGGTARPKEAAQRCKRLVEWWGDKTLAQVNGVTCRAYAKARGSTAARRELEDLRAAINYHRNEGLCTEVVEVVLPERSPSRLRFLTRSEAARLLWAAYRYREVQKGHATGRYSRRHLARFILVALYTGARSAAVCGAALEPTEGRGWINLDTGAFYRRADGQRETKKRQPPIRLPDRLLAHIRRWKRKGLCHKHVVEWNGDPVVRIVKAFRRAVADAGLDSDVTPHTLRHTAASWGMQNGADHGELADYLGMTIETLRRVYGHHDPNYLSDARDAIVRKPNFTERLNATKREQTPSGVAKLHRNH
jgi:integrase